jgi:hypothetical protein
MYTHAIYGIAQIRHVPGQKCHDSFESHTFANAISTMNRGVSPILLAPISD